MTKPSTSESNYIDELQSQFDKMRKYLDLTCLEKAREDSERLDWMERTLHVVCYNNGEWFCATRKDSAEWIDGPMAPYLRAAIDAAMSQETAPSKD